MTKQARAGVLVVNAGSSSLKLSVVIPDGVVTERRDIDRWDGTADEPALSAYLGQLAAAPRPPAAIGHRVVHGGTLFTTATLITDTVRAGIASLTPLAPLHQPRALAGIEAAAAVFGDVPQVACFDTAFHAGLPAEASTYPLPATWREEYGLRKFGFHGLSHSYAARRTAEMLDIGDIHQFRTVTCHLGAGSSLAAVQGGRSVETTMGFTPVDGLVMATRSGSVDPGLIAWLAARVPPAELADALEYRSGLAALAGLPDGSGDLRAVVAAAVAAMAAAMNGMDALTFTGGIGEHATELRAAAAARLAFLGVAVDQGRNASASADAEISAQGAPVRTLVVTAGENLEIARAVIDVLRTRSG